MQNLSDVEYWDRVARPQENEIKRDGLVYIRSNYHKGSLIMREMLKHDFTKKQVLEIGCGSAVIGAAMNTLYMGNIKYTGMDISKEFLKVARMVMRLNAIEGRATDMPFDNDSFDYIWMFDVFEHIAPEQREKVGQEIGRVLKNGGVLIMNSPIMESKHDEAFDFGLGKQDMDKLMDDARVERTKMKIIHYSTVTDPLRAYIYEEFKKI